MKATESRLCIYPKDIQRITGKSERYGRRLISRIKKQLGKPENHFITIEEFCAFTGFKEENVKGYLF